MLHNKKELSVVLVGNGDLKGKKLGNKIDDFDVVIRFNNFRLSKELSPDVGNKITIWCFAANVFHSFARKRPNCQKVWISQTIPITQAMRVADVYPIPFRINKQARKLSGKLPSTGFVAIHAALEVYKVRPIHIAGFTGKGVHHYWAKSRNDVRKENVHAWHKEQQAINRLIKQGKLAKIE